MLDLKNVKTIHTTCLISRGEKKYENVEKVEKVFYLSGSPDNLVGEGMENDGEGLASFSNSLLSFSKPSPFFGYLENASGVEKSTTYEKFLLAFS